MVVELIPLKEQDRNQFILDNQEAFNYGALEEFGRRDDHSIARVSDTKPGVKSRNFIPK